MGKLLSPRSVASIIGLLTALFIYLRVRGTIQWHWIWVVSPLWIALLAIGAIVSWMVLATPDSDYDR